MARKAWWICALATSLGLLYAIIARLGGVAQADCISCDAGWYQLIATEGYSMIGPGESLGHWDGADIHQTAWAFFPLYPWTIRAFTFLTGLEISVSFLVVGALLSALIAFLAFRLFSLKSSNAAASWGVLALFLQPFAIYFHLGMTEALFLSALLGAFLAIEERSGFALALSTTILVLTRPNGLFMLPVLLVYMAEKAGDVALLWKQPRILLARVWPMAFPLLAFAAYCAFQWSQTGNAFAFSTAQAGWDRHFTWPHAGFFNAGDVATQFDSWFTLALLALVFLLRKQLPFSMNLLLWISILLPLFSGTVASMPRFSTVLFPLFMLAGNLFARWRWRVPVLVASFLLQLGWLQLWLNGALITC
jgi:Gpi18-like mannosyltransferase